MAHQKTAQEIEPLAVLKSQISKTVYVEEFRQKPRLGTEIAIGTKFDQTIAIAVQGQNRDWEIAGTNASGDDVTFADGGGVTLTLDGASADQIFIIPNQDTAQTSLASVKWNTDDEIAGVFKIKTGSAITSQILLAGFTSDMTVDATFVLGDNDDELYFYYNPASSANWQAATSRSGTDTLQDLGSTFAVAASTEYELVIAVDSDRVPRFYINGELAHTAAALDAATDLYPRVGAEATATGAPVLTVRKIGLAKTSND